MTRRRVTLEKIEQESRDRFEDWRTKWRQKRLEIRRLPMLKKDRQSLRLELRQRELEELAGLRAKSAAGRKAVRSEYPITNWKKYLAYQAALNQPPVQVGLNNKIVAETAEGLPKPARVMGNHAGHSETPEISPRTEQDTRAIKTLILGR
jgi:hypothetical protein